MTARTGNRMGRPKHPQVEGHGRGTWTRRLHDNRRRQAIQTNDFILEQMRATEQRYIGYLAELDALDAEYEATLAAAKDAKETRPDAPLQKKKPASHDIYHDTPFGKAREDRNGELFIHSPKPAHERWTAWCAKHWDEYLKPLIVGTYTYTGPVIEPETGSKA